ncbi:MAG: response regulator, partial [Candidatus Sericytochromatia bacterium]
ISQLMGIELMSGLQQAGLKPEAPAKAAPVRVKTKTLLVMDDEPVIFQLIQDILEDSILKVITAASAREGLRLAMTSAVDVILLDANMPEISGLEAAEQLRHMRTTQDVPVILMSGQAPETLAPQLISAGIEEFLAKPFSPAELIQLLQKALGKEIFWAAS